MLSNNRKHLKLSEFQKQYKEKILEIEPSEPFDDWKRHYVIEGAGIIASGWTHDNKILLVSYDGYTIYDITKKLIYTKDFSNLGYEYMSKDNLSYIIPQAKINCSIFGMYGGDGNHVSSDGWKLEVISPCWNNSIVLIRKPTSGNRDKKRWNDIKLISLNRLEYFDLKCGFSPNENFFMIVNSGGAEVFKRVNPI